MKTLVEKLPHSRVALQIEVEPDRVEQALDRAYRRVVRRLDIPGFRRGRAPRALVEMRVGREALLNEALEELLPEVYVEAIEEAALEPVGEPSFDVEEAEAGAPLRLKAQVDVKPEVELGSYRGLSGERVIVKVTDEDVEQVLRAYQERHAQLVVPERDVLENGDFAIIDFEGFIDGKPFSGGAARGHLLEVGSGSFIPGFEEQLVGRKTGETFQVKVTFPTENVREDLAGREAVFQVTLKEIKVKQVPPIDDELAKEVGEADTLEEWRTLIRERLEGQAREEAEGRLRDRLFAQVVESSRLELPRSLVDGELEDLLEDLERSLREQGLTLDDYLRETELTWDELRNRLRERAEARVRGFLVADAIVKDADISVSEEEIAAEREKMISGLVGDGADESAVEALRKALAGDQRLTTRIVGFLNLKKVGELLVQEAQVEERWVDSLEVEDESAAEGAAEGSPDKDD